MKSVKIAVLLMSYIVILFCCACGTDKTQDGLTENPKPANQGSITITEAQNPEIIYEPDSYDSLDVAILLKKDEKNRKVTLFNTKVEKTYTLEVTGTSRFSDKYGEPMAFGQMQPGEIMEVTFLKEGKKLNTMQPAPDAWQRKAADRYILDWERKSATVGADVYYLPQETILLSEGNLMEVMDLNEVDELSFYGIGNDIVSIVVEKGHGYLRLENDSNFIGGFIEVGQSQIKKISEDMLLTVPEGNYQVVISHNGGGGIKNVSIARNKEVTLDIGDLEVVKPQYGTVIFTSNAEDGVYYVDGTKINADLPQSLEYGIHQIIVKAEGYNTLTSYFKVNKESTGIDLVLDKVKAETNKKEPAEQTYKVYIDQPQGTEVYLDGNYVGIAPVSFKKEAGSHTITLRKTGCETRSYTIAVDEEEKDISYSFAELVENASLSAGIVPIE